MIQWLADAFILDNKLHSLQRAPKGNTVLAAYIHTYMSYYFSKELAYFYDTW
jgi:hypothetical protein